MTIELDYGLAEDGGEVVEGAPITEEGGYQHNANHQQEAADYLLTQFDDSPDLHSWVKALIKPFQTLEDTFNTLRTAFRPSTAVGDQLTKVASIVGEPRAGRSDATLRAYTLARVAVNNSDGRAYDIYKVARIILGPEVALRAVRTYPAAYRLHITATAIKYPWDDEASATEVSNALIDLLVQATSAGVGVGLFFQGADDAHTFTLADGDVEQIDADRGLADDAYTQGGVMSDELYAV
jgi:hypothetical protein